MSIIVKSVEIYSDITIEVYPVVIITLLVRLTNEPNTSVYEGKQQQFYFNFTKSTIPVKKFAGGDLEVIHLLGVGHKFADLNILIMFPDHSSKSYKIENTDIKQAIFGVGVRFKNFFGTY